MLASVRAPVGDFCLSSLCRSKAAAAALLFELVKLSCYPEAVQAPNFEPHSGESHLEAPSSVAYGL